jgi:hypothetical protein
MLSGTIEFFARWRSEENGRRESIVIGQLFLGELGVCEDTSQLEMVNWLFEFGGACYTTCCAKWEVNRVALFVSIQRQGCP